MNDPITLTWAIVGAILLALELVLPGLIVIFLGTAALGVAAARWFGFIESSEGSWALFLGGSLLMIVFLRRILQRYVGGDIERASTNEDVNARGTVVTVVSAVGPNHEGRIRYRETTWAARSTGAVLPEGAECRLVSRSNLVWLVEPVDEG